MPEENQEKPELLNQDKHDLIKPSDDKCDGYFQAKHFEEVINAPDNILKLSREQIRYALRHIPKAHDIVLSAISEVGEQDLEALRLGYVHTKPWKRQEFIDGLKEMVKAIQTGEYGAEEEDVV